MKKSIIIFGMVFLLVSVWATFESGNQAFAISGCCKKRESANSPWHKFGTDLEQCKVENRKDDDNLLKTSGLVWWDMAC